MTPQTDAGYEPPRLLIDGEWLDERGRRTQAVINPANEVVLGQLPHATASDLDRALAATQRAFPMWRAYQPFERATILKRAADLIRSRAEQLATLVTLETGKPLAEAGIEVSVAANELEWSAEEGRRTYGRVIPSKLNGTRFLVIKEPVGPVAAFAAWNFPVGNAVRKLGTALAAGCTCIYKPGEEVPASSLAVGRALMDAGLPPGVVSIVFGVPHEVSEYLLASPVIRKVSFTGSGAVGKQLLRLAGDSIKRSTMELGGHAPVLVFDDADLDTAVEQSVQRKFRNAGQVCVSPTRFFIQDGLFEAFCEKFVAGARALKVGNGLDPGIQMGPLTHERRLRAVSALIEDARECGARVLTGGNRIQRPGYFWEPTVLAEVSETARIMREEPFGPVAILNRFADFDEAILKANQLPYGLAAFAFTSSARTLLALSDSIEAGMVGLNSYNIAIPEVPFGGIKESGHGSENGTEGIDACLITKTVSMT